ncbi:A0A024E1B4 (Uncharacterized protein) [Bacillus cereus]|nr:A0A024E1B4 (Uncharacterized protein) [Bacillus cereus]
MALDKGWQEAILIVRYKQTVITLSIEYMFGVQ